MHPPLPAHALHTSGGGGFEGPHKNTLLSSLLLAILLRLLLRNISTIFLLPIPSSRRSGLVSGPRAAAVPAAGAAAASSFVLFPDPMRGLTFSLF